MMNKWIKSIVILLVLLIFACFFVTSVVFVLKTFGESIDKADFIGYQISLLGIILTAVTLGGGIVGFLGWREIKDKTDSEVKDFINNTKEKIIKEAEERIMKKVGEEKSRKQETDILEKAEIKKL